MMNGFLVGFLSCASDQTSFDRKTVKIHSHIHKLYSIHLLYRKKLKEVFEVLSFVVLNCTSTIKSFIQMQLDLHPQMTIELPFSWRISYMHVVLNQNNNDTRAFGIGRILVWNLIR